MKQARHYKVDLRSYMAECEVNYCRIQQLLPDGEESVIYRICLQDDYAVDACFRLIRRCKYTSMVDVTIQGVSPYLANTHFELRVYHDARMAEVVGFQHARAPKPRYDYPNKKMYQVDEKFQQHAFLSECLANCLQNGLVNEQICTI